MKNSKHYPWILVALLWFVALLNYMDRQMIATMRPAMQLDITALQQATNFGRLMAVFLWVYGTMSVFSGIIADRFSRKWLIVGSLFVWSAVTFAMGYAQTFDQLYWLRAIMGFSEALYIPAGLSLIADVHSNKTRSLAVGIHMTGLYMGQALGGFGSTMSSMYSWQKTFIVFGFVGMAYAFVLLLLLQDKPKADRSPQVQELHSGNVDGATAHGSFFSGLFSLFRSFPFWIIVMYFAIPSLPGWAIKNWAPTLFAENLRIEMTLAGPLATVSISFSSLLGVLFGGTLSDRWVQTNNRGRIYTGAIGLLLSIPALLLMGFGTTLLPILMASFLFGFGFGMFDTNNMPILCQFVRPSQRATAYGFLNTAGIFSGALITDYLGKSTDAGNLGKDFALLGGIVFLAVLVQLIFLRPSSKEIL